MKYLFYDLETTGLSTRYDRIMQFAGQLTDEDLNPIADPVSYLIKVSDDCLPDPRAVLTTGITPQKTLEEGYTEAEFLEMFCRDLVQPDTVFVGFNSVRFDDEFMRSVMFKNFYDPYAWYTRDGRSRWDMLDLVRMTRALRPDGIEWPFSEDKKPVNRLELLSSANGIEHDHAHDALSDVNATIGLARLIKQKNPKIYGYLLAKRTKEAVSQFIQDNKMFVYTSGRYSSEWLNTTVVCKAGDADNGALWVYDLRVDPRTYENLSDDDLLKTFEDQSAKRAWPIKKLKPNACPAIAPVEVLDAGSLDRLAINMDQISKNCEYVAKNPQVIGRLRQLLENKYKGYETNRPNLDITNVDESIYQGFVPKSDSAKFANFRESAKGSSGSSPQFEDKRMRLLSVLYKGRNYPKNLNDEEREAWENYRHKKFAEGGEKSTMARYVTDIAGLKSDPEIPKIEDADYLLTELELWAESIAP